MGTLPFFVQPMLAAPGSFFRSSEHLYEPKWDGIRCLAFADREIRLMSRNGNDITNRFPELRGLPMYVSSSSWVLDGELVVLDEENKPSFDLVRDRNLVTDERRAVRLGTSRPAAFVAFDMLYCDGVPLLRLPLATRRHLLEQCLKPSATITLSPGLVGVGPEFHVAAVNQGMEGTVIKKLDSPYLSGKRSRHWVKVRHVSQTSCVVGGFIAKGPKEFGSLLLGQYRQDGKLLYVGHVGSGFTLAQNAAIASALRRIEVRQPLFVHVTREAQRLARWVEPAIVCIVEYLAWTRGGLLRHPVFRGVRTDKQPSECVLSHDHPSREGVTL